jgi:hypothetical protein
VLIKEEQNTVQTESESNMDCTTSQDREERFGGNDTNKANHTGAQLWEWRAGGRGGWSNGSCIRRYCVVDWAAALTRRMPVQSGGTRSSSMHAGTSAQSNGRRIYVL